MEITYLGISSEWLKDPWCGSLASTGCSVSKPTRITAETLDSFMLPASWLQWGCLAQASARESKCTDGSVTRLLYLNESWKFANRSLSAIPVFKGFCALCSDDRKNYLHWHFTFVDSFCHGRNLVCFVCCALLEFPVEWQRSITSNVSLFFDKKIQSLSWAALLK